MYKVPKMLIDNTPETGYFGYIEPEEAGKLTYSVPGTYTLDIEGGIYTFALWGGGGGAAQTDGGLDWYADTAWSYHYGHDGGGGGFLLGDFNLPRGRLKLFVGSAGLWQGQNSTIIGDGEDSYVTIIPEGSENEVEIIRVNGGHGGLPDGSSYTVNVPGGTVAYHPDYVVAIYEMQAGADGTCGWVVHI